MTSKVGPGHFFEDLSFGMEASIAHTVTAQDIEDFARVSGDVNPVHLDEAYAASTPFKQRIAHGILTRLLHLGCVGDEATGAGMYLRLADAHLQGARSPSAMK